MDRFDAAGPSQGRRPSLLVAVTDAQSLLLLRGQLRAAQEAGFEVTVLSAPGEIATRIAEAEGVTHVAIPMERRVAPLRDLVSLIEIIAYVRATRPDIINASTPKAGLLVIVAGWISSTPCLIHTLRGLRFETMRGPGRALLYALTKLSCRLADSVICISPSLRARAIELGLVTPKKAVVLGAGSSNGIDLGRFTPTRETRAKAAALRDTCGIPLHAPVLGFAGRIATDKGIVELHHAFLTLKDEYPELHFLLVGGFDPTDPLAADVRDALERDPRIHCVGHTDDMASAYLAMDIVALPTYREGFGNVLIEAAAMGRPTVACAVTGCVDAVEDGVTGILVPPRDAAALAAAIGRYLADDSLRARHGRAGRERVERLFRREDLWRRLHQHYTEILHRRGLSLTPSEPAGLRI